MVVGIRKKICPKCGKEYTFYGGWMKRVCPSCVSYIRQCSLCNEIYRTDQTFSRICPACKLKKNSEKIKKYRKTLLTKQVESKLFNQPFQKYR